MTYLTMKDVGRDVVDSFQEFIEYPPESDQLDSFQVANLPRIAQLCGLKFDEWDKRLSRFSDSQADSMAMGSVACKYWDLFLLEIEKKRLKFDTATKRNEQSHSKTAETSATTTEADEVETTNGALLQTQRAYPNGYTGETDSAYISAQVADDENTRNTIGSRSKTNTDTATDTSSASDIETDSIAKMELLKMDAQVSRLVSQFAFECLGDTIEGGF